MMATQRKALSDAEWEALVPHWFKHLSDFRATRTARAAIEQGNHLLRVKASLPHGEWLNHLANVPGLSANTAQRLMAVARRFSGAPDAFLDAVGSVSKLIELLTLDDAELLMRGEAVNGLTLERIEHMTVTELRVAKRDAQARDRAECRPVRQANLVRLSVEEERMLRLFRKCTKPAKAALFRVAEQLARS